MRRVIAVLGTAIFVLALGAPAYADGAKNPSDHRITVMREHGDRDDHGSWRHGDRDDRGSRHYDRYYDGRYRHHYGYDYYRYGYGHRHW